MARTQPQPASPSPQPETKNTTIDLGWVWNERKEDFTIAKIKEKDRSIHFYIIGSTGSGKTKFLEHLLLQDLTNDHGFGLIDPHGDLIKSLKGWLALRLAFIEAQAQEQAQAKAKEETNCQVQDSQEGNYDPKREGDGCTAERTGS